VGQLVQPGEHLVSLTQPTPAYINFMLPAKALGSIESGDALSFTTTSFPGRNWQGRIMAIDPQLDNSTRNIQIRAEVDNRDRRLVSGLYGQVVVTKQLAPQIFIPQEAVIYDPQGTSVYVLNHNIAMVRAVTLGGRKGNDSMVEQGLKPGDEVVTAGMLKLFPGTPVVVSKRVVQAAMQKPMLLPSR
jgi:membrane fusion protein (multidrug efflux system)